MTAYKHTMVRWVSYPNKSIYSRFDIFFSDKKKQVIFVDVISALQFPAGYEVTPNGRTCDVRVQP